jgi:hypothetical protein
MEAYDTHHGLLNEDNSTTIDSLALLSLVLRNQGKYEAAEETCRRVSTTVLQHFTREPAQTMKRRLS